MYLLTFPFNVLLILGPISSLILLASYFKGAVLIQVALVMAFGFLILKKEYLSREAVKDIIQNYYNGINAVKTREVHQMFYNSIFVSWISPCVVWANNSLAKTKFLLNSALITVGINCLSVVTLFLLCKFTSYGDFAHSYNPPILNCLKNPQEMANASKFELFTSGNSTDPIIKICPAYENCSARIRICSENEDPTDHLEMVLLPLVLGFQVLSLLAALALQYLGNYSKLFAVSKKLHLVGSRLIYHAIIDHSLSSKGLTAVPKDIEKFLTRGPEYKLSAQHALKTLEKSLRDEVTYQRVSDQFYHLIQTEKISVWKDRPPMHKAAEKGHFLRWCLFNWLGGRAGALNGRPISSISVITEKIDYNEFSLDRKLFVTRWWIERAQRLHTGEALHDATRVEDTWLMQLLLESGYDANGLNKEGQTPIELAIKNRHKESIELLIDHDARVNYQQIISNRQLPSDILELLVQSYVASELDSGHNKNNLGRGMKPLHHLAQTDQTEYLKFFLKYTQRIGEKDYEGRTPLHYAANSGSKGCLKVLLDHMADVNAKDCGGNTPLHLATESGHHKCMKILLEHKADVGARTKDSCTPLFFAIANKDTKGLKLLMDHGGQIIDRDAESRTPLHIAAQHGFTDLFKVRQIKELEVNARDKHDRTPLYYAAFYQHHRFLKDMIEVGANVDYKDKDRKTALHVAAFNGDHDCLATLIKRKADVNAKDKSGWTPLFHAADRGHLPCVQTLLLNNADIRVKDFQSNTALHATQIGAKRRLQRDGVDDIWNELVSHGIDADAKNNEGKTAGEMA